MKVPGIQRGMVQTTLGSMFYLLSDGRNQNQHPNSTTISNPSSTVDTRPPILCFHMSPRSSDEYLEVLPLLAAPDESAKDKDDGRVVIAFDLPGYGASENPTRSCTIDEISDACLEAADSILGSGSDSGYVTIGSLMGNYCCVSLASRHPDRIRAGIVTNPWFAPGATGTAPSSSGKDDGDDDDGAATTTVAPIPDSFALEDDGSHLVGLHAKRSGWLDNELNLRVVLSEIQYLSNRRKRYAEGINIEGGSDYDFVSAATTIVRTPGFSAFGEKPVPRSLTNSDSTGRTGFPRPAGSCPEAAAVAAAVTTRTAGSRWRPWRERNPPSIWSTRCRTTLRRAAASFCRATGYKILRI